MDMWKNFDVSWLKPGMWVKLRDSDVRLVLENTESGQAVLLVSIGPYSWLSLSGGNYSSDGTHAHGSNLDIMKVYKPKRCNSFPPPEDSLKWERKQYRVSVDGITYLDVDKQVRDEIVRLLAHE